MLSLFGYIQEFEFVTASPSGMAGRQLQTGQIHTNSRRHKKIRQQPKTATPCHSQILSSIRPRKQFPTSLFPVLF
jgi:hypothetical protein